MKAALPLAAIALGVRLLAWAGACTIGSDSFIFLDMARLMRGGEWSSALRWAVHPAYPAMIAALGGSDVAGAAVAVLLGAAAVIPLFLLVRDAVGEREAVVAALLFGVLPALVEESADIMTEGPFIFFFTSALWMGWRAVAREGSFAWAAAAGLLGGLAFLTRAEGLLAIGGVAAWLAVESVRSKSWRHALSVAIVLGVAFVIVLPFLLWVHRELGRWAISLKGAARAVSAAAQGSATLAPSGLYGRYLDSLWRVFCGILLPFCLWGVVVSFRSRGRLYLVSFGLAWMAAMLYAMPYVGYISYRYLLMGAVALLGAAAIGWLELSSKLREPIGRVALLVLLIAFAVLAVRPRRWHEASLADAGRWIATQQRGAKIIASTDKVAWYAQGELAYRKFWEAFPPTLEEFAVNARITDFIVITSRDPNPPYLARLDELTGFERVGDDFVRNRPRVDRVTIYRRRR